MATESKSNASNFVDANELATMLHVHRRTVVKWRRNKGLPSTKIGGRRKYHLDDVREWIGDSRVLEPR